MNALGAGLAGLAGGALVAAALLLAWSGPKIAREAVPLPAGGLGEVGAALARLEQRLAGLESALRAPEPRAPREALVSPDALPVPVAVEPPPDLAELREDLRLVSQRIDALTLAWHERDRPAFLLPTLEQVRSARRDVDWSWLGEIAELFLREEDAAQAQVRLMTFEQLLARAGVPNAVRTDDGSWMYLRPESVEGRWRGLYFRFVADSVSSVRTER